MMVGEQERGIGNGGPGLEINDNLLIGVQPFKLKTGNTSSLDMWWKWNTLNHKKTVEAGSNGKFEIENDSFFLFGRYIKGCRSKVGEGKKDINQPELAYVSLVWIFSYCLKLVSQLRGCQQTKWCKTILDRCSSNTCQI